MAQRPSLKLQLKAPKPEVSTTPQSAPTKLTLKFGGSSHSPASQVTPNDPTSSFASTGTKTAAKTPRKTKPTPKKRALEVEGDEDEDGKEPRSAPGPAIKKIKLKTHGPNLKPNVKLKMKGKAPKRPKGVGYDSEADDRELDPTLSEGFILRMRPGEDCDILRKAAVEGNFGRKTGGLDLRMRFLTSDGRRAAVTVNGRHYAAVLVDLPCVIEAMKNWEKRGPWMKSLDVCQMLIVMGPIKKEDDALMYPIPNGRGELNEKGELDEKTLQWASGITPPLHKVRTRRFRKRISVRDVMEVEAEVEALLRRDEAAEGDPVLEIVDENDLRGKRDREHGGSGSEGDDGGGGEDAEGEDYDEQGAYMDTTADADHDAMAEELEAAMELEAALATTSSAPAAYLPSSAPPLDTPTQEDGTFTPLSPSANNPATPSAAADTPGAATTTSADEASDEASDDNVDDDEDDDEEEEDEEEDDSSDNASVDEDKLERQQERQRQKEEIADLEAAIRQEQSKADSIGNALLRKKLLDKIRSLQADLDLKVAALGE